MNLLPRQELPKLGTDPFPELSMGSSGSASSSASVFDQFSDSVITNLWSTNAFRRAYWRGFWALVNDQNGPMRLSQLQGASAANHQVLASNGLSDPGYSALNSWMSQRFTSLTNQLARVRPSFHLLTTSASVTNQATFDLSGYAPVEAVLIRTNGAVLPVTWLNETQWVGTVGLSINANNFTVDGTDRSTNSLPPFGGEDYTDAAVITRY